MNDELGTLREQRPAVRTNNVRWLMLLGLGGLALFLCGAGVGALAMRTRSTPNAVNPAAASEPRGLKLADRKVAFAAGTIQTVEIRLPCSGLLSINLTFPKETSLGVFLVSPQECKKMQARQTFAHVNGFDARTSTGNYQRAAQLPPGRYALVLLDESASRSVVEVSARLSNLK